MGERRFVHSKDKIENGSTLVFHSEKKKKTIGEIGKGLRRFIFGFSNKPKKKVEVIPFLILLMDMSVSRFS